jgi:class 3 adenylate cyclase
LPRAQYARIAGVEGGGVSDERSLAIGFGDLRGFTSYTAERGDREALRVAEQFASVVRVELDEHGGRLLKTYGDGLMVSFEDALSAVRCVIDAQKALSEHNASHPEESLCAGFGLTWGSAIHTGDDLFGHSVNFAKRLADIAKSCQIVVSPEIRERTQDAADLHFRDLGEQTIKGLGKARLYEVVWRDEAAKLSLPDNSLDVVLTNDQRLVLEFAKPMEAKLEMIRAKLASQPEAKGPSAYLKRKMVARLMKDLPKWAEAFRRFGGAIDVRVEDIDASLSDGELRIQLPDGRSLAFTEKQIGADDAARFLAKLASLRAQKRP